MKIKLLKILPYFLYLISFVILGYYISLEIGSSFKVPTIFKLLCIVGSSIYIFFDSFILSKTHKNKTKKIKIISVWIIFVEYIILLIILILLDPSYGRGISSIFSKKSDILIYLNENSNFIPFKTIIDYIKTQNISFIIINVFGNIFAFMPFGIFLPLIFKKINFFKFIILMLTIVFIIEIMQVILLTGSIDIDDLILNVGGSLIIYKLYKKIRSNHGKI